MLLESFITNSSYSVASWKITRMGEQRLIAHLYSLGRDAFNRLLSASVLFKSQQVPLQVKIAFYDCQNIKNVAVYMNLEIRLLIIMHKTHLRHTLSFKYQEKCIRMCISIN